jgi:hypothetical protein
MFASMILCGKDHYQNILTANAVNAQNVIKFRNNTA